MLIYYELLSYLIAVSLPSTHSATNSLIMKVIKLEIPICEAFVVKEFRWRKQTFPSFSIHYSIRAEYLFNFFFFKFSRLQTFGEIISNPPFAFQTNTSLESSSKQTIFNFKKTTTVEVSCLTC